MLNSTIVDGGTWYREIRVGPNPFMGFDGRRKWRPRLAQRKSAADGKPRNCLNPAPERAGDLISGVGSRNQVKDAKAARQRFVHTSESDHAVSAGRADLIVDGCSATAACGSSSPSTVRKVPSSLSQKKSMTAKLVLAC
jgi:hypothetical protein